MKKSQTKKPSSKIISFLAACIMLFSYIGGPLSVFADAAGARATGSDKPITSSTVQGIDATDAGFKWLRPTPNDTLGGAKDFTLMVFGDLKSFHESEGPVAVANNIVGTGSILSWASVNPGAAIDVIPQFNVGAVLGGDVGTNTQVANGDAVTTQFVAEDKLTNHAWNNNNFQKNVAPFMNEAFADMKKVNEDYNSLAKTEGTSVVGAYGTLTFTGTNARRNVFEVTPEQFIGNIATVINVPDTSEAIIKVVGSGSVSINVNGNKIGKEAALRSLGNRTIWNFDPAITNITLESGTLWGTVIAPSASYFHGKGGYAAINGTAIVGDMEGGNASEIHYIGIGQHFSFTADIDFTKIDAETKEALTGATFGLFDKADADVKKDKPVYEQDKSSTSLINFKEVIPGTYYLKEISAPNGYKLSTKTIEITIDKNGKVTYNGDNEWDKTGEDFAKNELANTAEEQFGKFEFVKIGSDVDKLAGAKFALLKWQSTEAGESNIYKDTLNHYNSKKDIFKETISDANGVVSFDNIPEGKYSLIEVSAPKGYELTQKIVSIEVNKKGEISDSIIASLQNAFVNSSTKNTDIEFTKYGRNSGDTNEDYYWTQGGATFGLYEGYNATGNPIKTTVSSGDGVVKFDGLKNSTKYSIKEISAPDGYIKSEKIVNFKVGLAGVIWNDKGLIIGSDLDVGKSFVNERIPLGNLSFTKKAFFQPDKSETDGIWNLAGAKFNLSGTMVYDGANGKAYNKDIISTKAGLVELKEIPAGEYVLREITAPDGYTASTAQISVSVSKETGKTTFKKDGKEIQLVDLEQAFENEFIEIKGGFSINKTGRYMGLEATPLNNVRFALYNDKGELVGEETSTNANGVVDFKNISDGTYTLREFLPEGYTAAEGKTVTKYNGSDVVEYTVLVNGRTGETKIDGKVYTIANPIKIINQQIAKKGNFNVEKIKAYLGTDKGTLAGVTFTLKQGDVTIQEKVTDKDGFAAFVDLKSGNYKLIETVPEGYTAKQTEYDVFVDGKDGKVYIDVLGSNGEMQENIEYTTIKITNDFTALDGEFKLIKQSQYDKENPVPLKDVIFTLNGKTEDKNTAYIASTSTDKDGVISFSKIPAGKYTLTETVPAEHTATKTEYEVIVNGETGIVTIDGVVYSIANPITIINSKIAKKGNFQFTKLQNIYNEPLKPLIGVVATFTLTNDDTTQPLINVDVDQKTGEVIFTDIPAGTYTLTETFVDSRYEKSPNSVKVTVDGKTGEVTFEEGTSVEGLETLFQNKYTNAKSKFSFVKNGTFSGRDDYPIAGAKFELKNTDTNEAVTVTSGEDGIIEFSNIAGGKYILKEVNAPNGYKMSGGEMTVYADKYTGTVTFTDEKLSQADAELTKFFKNEKERKVQDFSFTKYKKAGDIGSKLPYEGVIFRLTDANGKFIDSDASGKDGIISFKNLADGEYILTELLSPDPLFIISNAKVKVVVDSFNNKITYFDVTNLTEGKEPTEIDIAKMETLFVNFFKDLRIGFSFDKKGSVDGGKTSYPLAGAEFTLNNNTLSRTVIADKNGNVSFTNIPNGLYTLAETKAPKGYELSGNTVSVEVNGNTGIVKFSYNFADIDPSKVAEKLSEVFLNNIEKRNGDFSFIKYGINKAKPTVAKKPLTGTAIFNLHGILGDATGFNDKKESASMTGLVAFSGLKNGSYILSELDSLADYIESKQLIWVEINTNVKPDQSVVSFFEATKTGENYTKGKAIEKSAMEDGFINIYEKNNGTLAIHKTERYLDEAYKDFSGIKFSLYLNGDQTKPAYSSETTDASGNAKFNIIAPGEYTLVETTPANYQPIKPIKVVVDGITGKVTLDGKAYDSNVTYEIKNERIREKIGFEFAKTHDDFGLGNVALDGAKFGLFGQYNSSVTTQTPIQMQDAASNSTIKFSDVKDGVYYLKEISAPAGYEISTRTIKVVVNGKADSKADQVKFYNEDVPNTGKFDTEVAFTEFNNNFINQNVEFTKFTNVVNDGKKETLSGAEFKLEKASAKDGEYSQVGAAVIASADGKVEFKNLTPGFYKITETASNNPFYDKSEKIYEFEISIDGKNTFNKTNAETDFENKLKNEPTSIQFLKKSTDGLLLADTTFQLIGKSTDGKNDVLFTVTTLADGIVKFDGLFPGDYEIKETKAQQFYQPITVAKTFKVNPDGTTTLAPNELEDYFKNSLKDEKGEVSFVKYGSDKERLAGTEFKLTGKTLKGDVVAKDATSDKDGIVKFTELEAGDYVIEETESLPFYEKVVGGYTFKVNPDGTLENFSKTIVEDYFINKLKDVMKDVSFVKKGSDSKFLEGTEFTLTGTRLDDTEFKDVIATADVNGKVSFNGLHAGDYTIKETKALDFYLISGGEYKFTVNPDATTTFDANKVTAAFVNKLKDETADVEFVKNGSDGKTIAGAEFTLTGKRLDGEAFKDVIAKSGVSGLVTFTGLHAGDYVITETQATDDYIGSTKEYKFKVTPDGKTNFDAKDNTIVDFFVNKLKDVPANVEFVKRSNDFKLLEGTGFTLTGVLRDGTEFASITATADAEGVVKFNGLHAGDYTITETDPLKDYIGSGEVYGFKVNPNGTTTFDAAEAISKFVNKVKEETADVSFVKKGSDGKLLDGTVFTLTGTLRNQVSQITPITVTAKNGGNVSFTGLHAGDYVIEETTPLDNYTKVTAKYSFAVAPNGDITPIVEASLEDFFVNERKDETADIMFYKYGETGKAEVTRNSAGKKPLAGTEFTLTGTRLDGTEFKDVIATADENGKVIITGLHAGDYTIKETKALDFYEIFEGEYKFTVQPNGDTDFKQEKAENTFFNRLKDLVSNIEFVKKGSDVATLGGATFELTGTLLSGATVTTKQVVSDTNGLVKFDGLHAGDYVITEISSPEFYDKATVFAKFTVNPDGTNTFNKANAETDFVNELQKIPANVEFVKMGESEEINATTNVALKGTEFELTGTLRDGTAFAKVVATSDENGKVSFKNLFAGKYTITETKANPHYVPVTNAKEFIVYPNGKTNLTAKELDLYFFNNLQDEQGEVSFVKYGSDQKVLAGTEFKLTGTTLKGGAVAKDAIADGNGVVNFTGLEAGDYSISETTALDFYEKVTEAYSFKVFADGTTNFNKTDVEEFFINQLKDVLKDVSFVKKGTDGKLLAGTEFTLTGTLLNGEAFASITSIADANGVVKFNGLHAGDYVIKETKALDFYVISDGTYKFTVNPDGSCDFKPQGPEDIFINKLKDETTNVSFVKKGSDGMFLAGTEFTLTGKLSNGTEFKDITAIADANGVVKFNDLHAGDYSLKETKALPFYQISTKEYKFKVAPNGETNFSVEVETLFVNARKDIAFDFTFTKLDGEGNALAGAEFALENENGEKTVVTSDESGSVSFGNLHEGVYTLTETKAPTGYAISEAIIKLKVNPDGTILNANDQPLSILDITNEMVNYLEEIITPPETPIAPPPNGDNEKPTPPEEEEINPNDVPMAEPPKTSDSTTLLTVALILAGISLSVIIARKKFVED